MCLPFVPIMWFIRPYQVMEEMWQASYPGDKSTPWSRVFASPLLRWWWAAWTFAAWLGDAAVRLFGSDDTIADMIMSDWLLIGSNVADIVATLLFFLVIRQITSMQEKKHGILRSAGGAGRSFRRLGVI